MRDRLLGLIDKLTPQNQRLFACDCAERALLREERDHGMQIDPRTWNAVHVARAFAMGRASEEELEEAEDAALLVVSSAETDIYMSDFFIYAMYSSAASATFSPSAAVFYAADYSEFFLVSEAMWQIARATAYYEAQETAHPSLLSVLLQRKKILEVAVSSWQRDTEEMMF